MALVKCPECGRDNVSDSAEHCPACGFGIKNYYKNVLAERAVQQYKEELKEYDALRKAKQQLILEQLQPELDEELQEIDNLPMPTQPSFWKTFMSKDGFGKLITEVIIISFVLTFFFIQVALNGVLAMLCGIVFSFALVLGLPFVLYVTYIDYSSDKHTYDRETADWDKTLAEKKEAVKAQYDRKAYQMMDETFWQTGIKEPVDPRTGKTNSQVIDEIFASQEAMVPKCPYCGSWDFKKISAVSKSIGVVSLATIGIPSKKMFYDFKCNNCGKMW